MKKKFYLPRPEPQRVAWHHTYTTKLPLHAATISAITPADITQAVDDDTFNLSMFALLDNMKTFTKNLTDFRNLEAYGPQGAAPAAPPFTITIPTPVPTGVFARVSNLVKRIKADPNYTNNIGLDLGIVGEDETFDPVTYKPEILSIKVQPGPHIILHFSKDETDGANFYCRTNGGPWVKRAYDTNPPYDDYTPLAVADTAEKREYRCRGVIDDVEIGVYSEIETVTVSE